MDIDMMKYRCPACGLELTAEGPSHAEAGDVLFSDVENHLRMKHPDMVGKLDPAEIKAKMIKM